MWWALGGAAAGALLAIELARFARHRAAERDAARRYAGYAEDDPGRAAALVEIRADAVPRAIDGIAAGTPAGPRPERAVPGAAQRSDTPS